MGFRAAAKSQEGRWGVEHQGPDTEPPFLMDT